MIWIETTIPVIEAAIGLPARDWKGQCHKLARLMLEFGFCSEGKLVEECAWTGPVAPGSRFAEFKGTYAFGEHDYMIHTWIALPDGWVCDPTRWVFEDVEPYVYVGPADFYNDRLEPV